MHSNAVVRLDFELAKIVQMMVQKWAGAIPPFNTFLYREVTL